MFSESSLSGLKISDYGLNCYLFDCQRHAVNVDDNYFETGETYHKRLVHWNNQIVKSWSIFEVYYMCVIDVNITCVLIALFLHLFRGIYYLSFSDTSRNAALTSELK